MNAFEALEATEGPCALLESTSSACRVYACGPAVSVWERKAARKKGTEPTPRFLEAALEALKAVGVRPEQITKESYG